MATVKVEFSTDAFVSKVWMDGIRIQFSDSGKAQKDLTDGRIHVLQWTVRGAPAATYSIKVTAPPTIKKDLAEDEALGSDRIGFGQYEFQL